MHPSTTVLSVGKDFPTIIWFTFGASQKLAAANLETTGLLEKPDGLIGLLTMAIV